MSYFDLTLEGSESRPCRLALKLSPGFGLCVWAFTQSTLDLLVYVSAPPKDCSIRPAIKGGFFHVGNACFHVSDFEADCLLAKFGPAGLCRAEAVEFHSPAPHCRTEPDSETTLAHDPPGERGVAAAPVLVGAAALEVR